MLKIDNNGNIEITRGDMLPLTIKAKNKDGSDYTFQPNDVIRFSIVKKKDCNCVEFQKDFTVEEQTTSVNIDITANETKLGELNSKPVDYWYEVELNPDTEKTQTIIGYTKEKGPKLFTLLPESSEGK